MGFGFGITPLSSQGYEVSSTVPLDTSSVSYIFKGDGSVNKLLIGNGFNILNKGDTTRISLGLNCSYLFGNLDRTSTVVYNNSNDYNSRIQYRSSLSGWGFDVGLQIFKRFKTASNNKLFFNLGVNYSLSSDITTDNDFFAYTFKYNFSVQEFPKDTLAMENENSNMVLLKIKFGCRLVKYKTKEGGILALNSSIITQFFKTTLNILHRVISRWEHIRESLWVTDYLLI